MYSLVASRYVAAGSSGLPPMVTFTTRLPRGRFGSNTKESPETCGKRPATSSTRLTPSSRAASRSAPPILQQHRDVAEGQLGENVLAGQRRARCVGAIPSDAAAV